MSEQEVVESAENQSDAVVQDLRCSNPGCTLRGLKLEADEVTPEPAFTPDRCASCGAVLTPHSSNQP